MSGLAFLLFTFYMVSDPATTPDHPRRQVVFGAAVAIVYGILVSLHVVFGLFFALTVVCAVRGLYLYWASRRVTITAGARALAGREQQS
jgi:Na+-translocating ferredoxin:NAD+ oxidoreductase RnfD subunit